MGAGGQVNQIHGHILLGDGSTEGIHRSNQFTVQIVVEFAVVGSRSHGYIERIAAAFGDVDEVVNVLAPGGDQPHIVQVAVPLTVESVHGLQPGLHGGIAVNHAGAEISTGIEQGASRQNIVVEQTSFPARSNGHMVAGSLLGQVEIGGCRIHIRLLIEILFNVGLQRGGEADIIRDVQAVVYLIAVSLYLFVTGGGITVVLGLTTVRIVKEHGATPCIAEIVLRPGIKPGGILLAVDKDLCVAFAPPDAVDKLIDVQAGADIAAFPLNVEHLCIRCSVIGAGIGALPVGMEAGQIIGLRIGQGLRCKNGRDRTFFLGLVGQGDLRGVEGHIPGGIDRAVGSDAVACAVKFVLAIGNAVKIRNAHADGRAVAAIPVHGDLPVHQRSLLVKLVGGNGDIQRGCADRAGQCALIERYRLAGLNGLGGLHIARGNGGIRQNVVGSLQRRFVFLTHRPPEGVHGRAVFQIIVADDIVELIVLVHVDLDHTGLIISNGHKEVDAAQKMAGELLGFMIVGLERQFIIFLESGAPDEVGAGAAVEQLSVNVDIHGAFPIGGDPDTVDVAGAFQICKNAVAVFRVNAHVAGHIGVCAPVFIRTRFLVVAGGRIDRGDLLAALAGFWLRGQIAHIIGAPYDIPISIMHSAFLLRKYAQREKGQ